MGDPAPVTTDGMTVGRPRSVFYGWWMAGTAAFMLTIMAVTVFQGLGVFLVGLQNHFGWSRTSISGAFSLARVEGAALGPLEGFLVDRMGTRRMVLIGTAVMGVGFILFSMVQNLWQFYAAFALIALGSGLGGWLAMVSLVNNWFVRRRSFALAVATSGVHLGGFMVPLLALGIELHGVRQTALGVGVFLLVAVIPVARIIRNRPEEYGLQPDGDPQPLMRPLTDAASPPIGQEEDFTARQALRTPVFWLLSLVHTSSTISIATLSLHLVPKLTDMGLSLSASGMIVLMQTGIALPAQFVAGLIADRLPKPPLICLTLLLQASGLMVLAFAERVPLVFVFALLFGLGFGGRMPLLTAIRGEYFGRKAYATIMGVSMLPNNLAMIGAPLFAAYMFDRTGSYLIPFAAFAGINFTGGLMALAIRPPRSAGH